MPATDRDRARRILRNSYGSNPGQELSPADRKWLEDNKQGNEDNILDTAQRFAGDNYNWRWYDWADRAAHFASLR